MSELSFEIHTPPTGITFEYEPAQPSYDEAGKRGRLENVTAAIIVAADAAMRARDFDSMKLHDQLNDVFASLGQDGFVVQGIEASRNGQQRSVLGLYRLSTYFTQALMHPANRNYSIGGFGTPEGGYNLLGDVAVSHGYDYDSPLGRGVDGSHWYKKTVQMVASSPRQLTVGAYAYSQQHIQPNALRAVFEASEFASFIGETGVRIADKQPTPITELSSSVYNGAPSEIVLAGMHDYLSSQSHLSYAAFQMSRPSRYGASARATVRDDSAGLGLAISLSSSPTKYEEEIQMTADPDVTTFRVTNEAGSPAALSSMQFSIKPIAFNKKNGQWMDLRQDENVIQRPHLVAAAQELNAVVEGIHSRLTEMQALEQTC